jgi:hypothetical protein
LFEDKKFGGSVLVESVANKKWYKVVVLPEKYSTKINADWLTSGEISTISMGFLLIEWTSDRILEVNGSCNFMAASIVMGFQAVRKSMMMNREDRVVPRTWIVTEKMAHVGLEKLSDNVPIPASFVFEDEFIEENFKKWVASTKRKDKSIGKKPEQKDPSKKDIPSKTDSKKRKTPTLDGAAAKDKKVVHSRKKQKSAKLDSSSSVQAKSASLTLHPEDAIRPADVPKNSNVKESRELLKQMENYYIFGSDSIFDIPVDCICPPPATLVYRMINRDHVKEIVESMIKNPGQEPQIADLIPFNCCITETLQRKRQLS